MRGLSSGSTYRLTRSRTNDTTSPAPSPLLVDPVQTSYEDLKRPEARQLLKEQLTDTFRGSGRPSLKSRASTNMPLKERFTRRSSALDIAINLSAKSSSSTVDCDGPQRVSTAQEDNKAIDLERAIHLLQELKKTASPDELVALHRALLPTKEIEVVASAKVSAFDEQAAFSPSPGYQRRSNLPPGLATRGGVAEDLLRKQREASTDPQKPGGDRQTRWLQHSVSMHGPMTHTASKSVSSLAALDLADDNTNPVGARVTTPLESPWSHAGGYRPGTLHITNGAASPEPSLRAGISNAHTTTPEPKQRGGYFASSGGGASIDIMEARTSIDMLPRRMSEESLPIRDRILNSNKAQQQRRERAHRLSGMSTPSKESLGPPLQISTKASRPSLDYESISPVSETTTPRFQQRWSHRASQISAEYMSDCELSASPYEEKNALLSFATRLSTVYDRDADEADDGTPAAALSRLTGDLDILAAHAENVANSMSASEGPVATTRFSRIHRPPPRKTDSGYASDHSFRNMTRIPSNELRKSSLEAASAKRMFVATEAKLHELDENEDEQADHAAARSLYTLREILKSSQAVPEAPSSPKTSKSKKSSSLLRLHTLRADKRSSLPTMSGTDAAGSSDSIPTIASMQESPADATKAQHIAKQQKKLQKAMPPSVKKQRKEEMRKLKAAKAAVELHAVPGEVSATHARRMSQQHSSANFDHTDPALETTHLQEDLDAPLEMNSQAHVPSASPSPVEAKRSTSRNRSKSRGRGRSNSIRQSNGAGSSPDTNRSWGIANLRSKSASRARSQTPKRSSFDVVTGRARPSTGNREPVSPGDENVPAWTDFSSVARSLGSGSYDIATNQTKRVPAPAPGATLHQLQSPYLVSTGLDKAKSIKSMNSEAASEMARMKSRDFAENDKERSRDKPKIAFPKLGKSRAVSGPYRPNMSVEDRFPGWQGKPPPSRESCPQRPQIAHRPHSMYAESIPPIPELPADAAVKASKADVMVARKLKDSAASSPAASARTSQEAQHGGVPELVTKMTTTVWHSNTTPTEKSSLDLLHHTERAASKQAAVVNVQVRELAGSGSEQSSFAEANDDEPLHPPSHDSQHPGWPSWEQQAKAWRQRRESLGAALGRAVDEASVITAETPPVSRKPSAATLLQREPSKSPSIVVSRYITPVGAENAAGANMRNRQTHSATQRANAYRDLNVEDKENRPAKQDVPRTDSAVTTRSTTSTFVTVKSWDPRPVKQDVPRTDSTFSTNTYATVTTTSIGRARPGEHNCTPSGKYIAYSPSQASMAERSRAQSLAKVNGNTNDSTTSLGTTSQTRPTNKSTDSLVDRYSGGLQYGWDRDAGFSGSAGTRHSSSDIKRKSVRMSESFGLDLSDVPVFLVRR